MSDKATRRRDCAHDSKAANGVSAVGVLTSNSPKIVTMAPAQFLQTFRSMHRVTRFMLVWFVLSLGAAIASPLINPQSTEIVCSGLGMMKVVVKNADGSSTESVTLMLDCPMCAPLGAPPPVQKSFTEPVQPLGHALKAIPAAHIAAATAVPPPARGPPTFS